LSTGEDRGDAARRVKKSGRGARRDGDEPAARAAAVVAVAVAVAVPGPAARAAAVGVVVVVVGLGARFETAAAEAKRMGRLCFFSKFGAAARDATVQHAESLFLFFLCLEAAMG